MLHLRLSDPTVRAICQAAYPEYTGKDIRCRIADTIQFRDTNWSEGSRRYYKLVSLNGLKVQPIPDQRTPWDSSPLHEAIHNIPDGCVYVVENIFRGKSSLEIVAPQAVINPLLPAPQAELTADEMKVLDVTCGYISSYRKQEYARAGLTPERVESAKKSLNRKGLLTKVGGVTVEGRNARQAFSRI